MRALEGEGRGLSHLEAIARGRLWRQLACRDLDRGAQRAPALPVTANPAATNHEENDVTLNSIDWWISKFSTFPTLYRYALDSLSSPAMSTECEGVFSSIKELLTTERNRPMEDIIETCECLKAWWKKDLIKQQED